MGICDLHMVSPQAAEACESALISSTITIIIALITIFSSSTSRQKHHDSGMLVMFLFCYFKKKHYCRFITFLDHVAVHSIKKHS